MTVEELKQAYKKGLKVGLDAYKAQFEKLDGDIVAQFLWARNAAVLFDIPDAMHHVIDSYLKGKGVEPNRVAAFEWLRKGAEQSEESFYFDLAMAYRDGEGTAVNIDEFRHWMGAAAKNKYDFSEAMHQLADAHRKPAFGKVSEKRAFELIEKMADSGVPDAMIEVALAFRDGKVVKKDSTRFLELAKKASEAAFKALSSSFTGSPEKEDWAYEDYPLALSTLANAYELKEDKEQAVQTAKKAATAAVSALSHAKEREDHISGEVLPEIIRKHWVNLGISDSDTSQNCEDYFSWLQKIDAAIDQTDSAGDEKVPSPELADAIFKLAMAHKNGIGTKANSRKFLKYLEKSARAEHPEAMYLLAMNYRDSNKLLDFSLWITRAVIAGNQDALIAKTLDQCGLKKSLFKRLRLMLQSLLKLVITIRTEKHSITEDVTLVAHYTDSNALKSMLSINEIENNSLRLFNVAYVNDPSEGQKLIRFKYQLVDNDPSNPLHAFFGKDPNVPIIPEERINLQEHDFWTFIGSFSLVKDRLDLWRAYGRDGNGFCILTPLNAFQKKLKKQVADEFLDNDQNRCAGGPLYKVCYEDLDAQETLTRLSVPLHNIVLELKKKNYSDTASKAIRRLVVTIISELLYLYKDKEYETEKEVRMIVARPFDSPQLKRQPKDLHERLYIETDSLFFESEGCQIVIGPKVASREEVEIDILHRLAKLGWPHCSVQHSQVKYR